MRDLNSLTLAELSEGYSDCFKSLHGFRPTGEAPSRERLIAFWSGYDDAFACIVADEADELAELGFATWADYYADLESREAEHHARWLAEAAERQAVYDAYHTRLHPRPVIEAWEHGDSL